MPSIARFRIRQRASRAGVPWAVYLVCAVHAVICGSSSVHADPSAAADAGALYAPVDFLVVDAEATARVAQKAGEALPLVVVLDPEVPAVVVAAFTEAYAHTRAKFLDGVEATFGARTLDEAGLGGIAFREFRTQFQDGNPSFPVSLALGQSWAGGNEGGSTEQRISSLLRAVQRDHLIGAVRPASTVFVVEGKTLAQARTWGEAVNHTRVVDRSEIISLDQAGERLRRMNDPLDRAASGYLSGLLRTNVTEDAYLTGLLLHDRKGRDTVHRLFSRGERLVPADQAPDRWAELALEALARQGLKPSVAPLLIEDTPAGTPSAAATSSIRPIGWGRWLAGSAAVIVGALGAWVAWVLVRRRHEPATVALTEAAQAHGRFGDVLIPQFARELRDRLVRALFTQRSVLLANEQAASRRVQEMEDRLARLQPAIAERIRSYEQRIEALEKEIAERDVETRDLIRAKLVLARKELDAEITRNRIDWN